MTKQKLICNGIIDKLPEADEQDHKQDQEAEFFITLKPSLPFSAV
jgi:hypothetical protein